MIKYEEITYFECIKCCEELSDWIYRKYLDDKIDGDITCPHCNSKFQISVELHFKVKEK